MHRRLLIALLGGAIALSCVAAAQQKALPVISARIGSCPSPSTTVAPRIRRSCIGISYGFSSSMEDIRFVLLRLDVGIIMPPCMRQFA
jgi:hypothetical protein